MKQETNTPEWLSAQESFQHYCLEPHSADGQFWKENIRAQAIPEQTVKEARRIVMQLALQPSAVETEAELQRFRRAISPAAKKKSPTNVRRIFQIAATIALLLTAYWVWDEVKVPPTSAVATTFGETRTVELADGSLITLNANSNIRYVEDFSTEEEREIWLEGEAFFEVAHRQQQPFVVHTEMGDISVLGTSFNVADRPGQFDVTLVEGSVQFELNNQKIIKLSPNEQLGIHNDTLYHRKVDVEGITAWRYDRMVFKNAPISTIVKRLERDFNWTVKVSNQSILTRKVNATIPKNDPALLLEALSVLYDLDIEKISEKEYRID